MGAQGAFGQATPFNMTPGGSSAPQTSPAPAPSQTAPTLPFDMRQPGSPPAAAPTPRPPDPQPAPLAGTPAPFSMGPRNTAPPAGAVGSTPPPVRAPAATNALAARSPARIERPILPFETLRFEGETD